MKSRNQGEKRLLAPNLHLEILDEVIWVSSEQS